MEMSLHSPVTLTSTFLVTLVWGVSLSRTEGVYSQQGQE